MKLLAPGHEKPKELVDRNCQPAFAACRFAVLPFFRFLDSSVSTVVPICEGFISNETGRVKSFFNLFLLVCVFFLPRWAHSSVCADARFYWTDNFRPSSVSDPCPPYSLSPWSLHHFGVAHQPSLRSLWTMRCLCELPLLQGGGVA
jgi:hypothetical protein